MNSATIARGAMTLVLSVAMLLGFAYNPSDSLSSATGSRDQKAKPKIAGSLRAFESLRSPEELLAFDEDVFSIEEFEDTTITATIAGFRAQSLFDKVEEAQRFVDYLDETSLLELPVGIKKTIGNIQPT